MAKIPPSLLSSLIEETTAATQDYTFTSEGSSPTLVWCIFQALYNAAGNLNPSAPDLTDEEAQKAVRALKGAHPITVYKDRNLGLIKIGENNLIAINTKRYEEANPGTKCFAFRDPDTLINQAARKSKALEDEREKLKVVPFEREHNRKPPKRDKPTPTR